MSPFKPQPSGKYLCFLLPPPSLQNQAKQAAAVPAGSALETGGPVVRASHLLPFLPGPEP